MAPRRPSAPVWPRQFSAIAVPPGAQSCSLTPPPPLGSNLLSNQGFESGNTLWSTTSEVIGQWGPEQPARTGTWSAWLGGYGVIHDDSISQLVTIPTTGSATLSYYVHTETAELLGSTAYDTMTVRAGSTVLQRLSNLDAASGYQIRTVSLSGYAGQTISISFSGAEDGAAFTSFVLDDISVIAPVARAPGMMFSPLDFSGDGKSDVLRVTPIGDLLLYRGTGTGGLGAATKIGAGWGGFINVFSPGDFTGDGKSDVLGATPSGDLYLYRGNGKGAWLGSAQKIASGMS